MPRPELAPPDQWATIATDSTTALLRNPVGQPYDPNSLPSWLTGNGLSFLQEHGAGIGTTVLLGMQQDPAELSDALPKIPANVSILGIDTGMVQRSEGEQAYFGQVAALLRNPTPVKDIFDIWSCGGGTPSCAANVAVAAAADEYYDAIDPLTEDSNEETLRKHIILGAMSALAIDTAAWHVLEHAGLITKEQGANRGHMVLGANPILSGIERNLHVLDIKPQVIRLDEAHWPTELSESVVATSNVLATGLIPIF